MKPSYDFFLPRWLRHWSRCISYCVLPPRCLVCTQPGMPTQDLCVACHTALPWNLAGCRGCALPLPTSHASTPYCGQCLALPSVPPQVCAAFIYDAPVDGLLRRFKFHQDLAAGHLLSGLMLETLRAMPRPQALVPIPLHRTRLRQRGYDQARALATPLGAALQIPVLDGLRRVRLTQAQSGLDAAARARNVRGAFSALAPLPSHVALVDDVMTTGATLNAARQALRKAGVARVDAWVCARVP